MVGIFKKKFNKTFYEYFFSYIIIFLVCFVGFFLILKNQIMVRYKEQLMLEKEAQLSNMIDKLEDDFAGLTNIEEKIRSESTIYNYMLSGTKWDQLDVYNRLGEYEYLSDMIKYICFIDKKREVVLNKQYGMSYEDGKLFITKDEKEYIFNVDEALDSSGWKLEQIDHDNFSLFIYFPNQKSSNDYIFFFILKEDRLREYLKSFASKDMPSIAIINQNGQILTGIDTEPLAIYLEEHEWEKQDDNDEILSYSGFVNRFYVVAKVSTNALDEMISEAFWNGYIWFGILMIVAFLLVIMCMHITYRPLRRFARKIAGNNSQGLLEQIERAYVELVDERDGIGRKLHDYQISIRKALLETALNAGYPVDCMESVNLDVFFEEGEKEIYAIQIITTEKLRNPEMVQNTLLKILPKKEYCVVLCEEEKSILLLVNYAGYQLDKKEKLKEALVELYESTGYYAAICGGSDSPLDIPVMCEKIKCANKYWPDQTVVEFELYQGNENRFVYPYEELQLLEDALRYNRVVEAKECLNILFSRIDELISYENTFPEYYERSILIDILSCIMNIMNDTGIVFVKYQDIYYELLFLCRNSSYVEKKAEIVAKIQELLDIYEQHKATMISGEKLKSIIEECCCKPDFSIYEMADQLGISFSYTSLLVKKELGQNFSEYLWELRLKKAKELLSNTNENIEEICYKVGYLSVSSFYKKFKRDTGYTPYEYRMNSMNIE